MLPVGGEQEPLRIWGHIEDGVIVKAESPAITTQCIRVPVLDGHTAAVPVLNILYNFYIIYYFAVI